MMYDFKCEICSGNTVRISPVLKVTENSKFNWENDSTMELLGWKEAEAQVRFCKKCFHSIIFPKFEASGLYGDRGVQVRKKHFETYFPGKIYGKKDEKLSFGRHFRKMSYDLSRFRKISLFVARLIQTKFEGIKGISILDWGGGDGFVSTLFANSLRLLTGVPTSSFIYDYTTWSESGTNKVGIKDLEKMEPFHIIIFSHVLEHTHNPVNTIKAAKNFMADQGLIICEVPDARINNIKALLQINHGLNYHICSFSRRSLHSLLKKSGLQNIHTVYQYNSSYRGIEMSSILGIAQTGNIIGNENVPAVSGEIFSLICFFIRKVFSKMFLLFSIQE